MQYDWAREIFGQGYMAFGNAVYSRVPAVASRATFLVLATTLPSKNFLQLSMA